MKKPSICDNGIYHTLGLPLLSTPIYISTVGILYFGCFILMRWYTLHVTCSSVTDPYNSLSTDDPCTLSTWLDVWHILYYEYGFYINFTWIQNLILKLLGDGLDLSRVVFCKTYDRRVWSRLEDLPSYTLSNFQTNVHFGGQTPRQKPVQVFSS
jgi:hypothetical protein